MSNTLPCLCRNSYCTQFLPNGLNSNKCSIKPEVTDTSSCIECPDYVSRSKYLGKIKPCPGCGTAKVTPIKVQETPIKPEEPKVLHQPISVDTNEVQSNIDLDAQEITERLASPPNTPARKFKKGK